MLDEITIEAVGGAGGNGAVSVRRAKYEPKGGPDGGDGGSGGDVIMQAEPALYALDSLRRRRMIRAVSGGDGSSGKKHGKKGKDVVLSVPVGTVVWRMNGREWLLCELLRSGERVIVARGGKGGRGNARMATSTRRRPGFAERGVAGESVRLRLQVRLLADVGIVGLPNAGKSSLLRALTAAKPKVGAYEFTTLAPHLGVAEVNYEQLVLADVPGLVEGAAEGTGLGARFLRHAERTRALLYVVDASRPLPEGDLEAVRREVAAFGQGLVKKRTFLALNKVDLPGARERAEQTAAGVRGRGEDACLVSALTGEGVPELLRALFSVGGEQGRVSIVEDRRADLPVLRPQLAAFQVRRTGGTFRVEGARPEEAAEQLGAATAEARLELARRLRRMGVVAALRRVGVEPGDRVRIGRLELEWPL